MSMYPVHSVINDLGQSRRLARAGDPRVRVLILVSRAIAD
jgi:hypothetical protein